MNLIKPKILEKQIGMYQGLPELNLCHPVNSQNFRPYSYYQRKLGVPSDKTGYTPGYPPAVEEIDGWQGLIRTEASYAP